MMNTIVKVCLFYLFMIQCINGSDHNEIPLNNSFAVCYNIAHSSRNLKTPQYHNITASFFAKYQKPDYYLHCHAKSISFF
uniref:Secreted protein n=1 Tax=Strongyloides venezuelensis TaxID=75913 RepID=A0A0K0G5Q1_STRVS